MNPEAKDALSRFSSFTIAHPAFRQAVDTIHEAIQTTSLRNEPSSVLLLGDGGTGKTRICEILAAKIGKKRTIQRDDEVITIRPLINCNVPPNATIKWLISNILEELGSHKNNQSLSALENRLYTLLDTCRTQFVTLDEWQHLIKRGAEPTRDAVCDWVKVFVNTFNGTVMLAGTPECESIVDYHEQLAGRFPYRAYLRNFSIGTPGDIELFSSLIGAFANEIIRTMPLHDIPPLTDDKFVLALYANSAGNLRFLRLLLHAALTNALERTDGTLTKSDFSHAFTRIHSPKRLTKEDPYEMTLLELQKSLFRR
ncbi:TniB family NTP-binding protein [Pseudomonas sp. MOB-449]|nr:TniB family NTP-binding protein [Pseudomonas sp. MOB-449]